MRFLRLLAVSVCLMLAGLALSQAEPSRTEIAQWAKKAIGYENLPQAEKQAVVSFFRTEPEARNFLSQLGRFWKRGPLVRLVDVKISADERYQTLAYASLQYLVGTVDSGTAFIQRLDLKFLDGQWVVIKHSKITVAPVLAPASPPG